MSICVYPAPRESHVCIDCVSGTGTLPNTANSIAFAFERATILRVTFAHLGVSVLSHLGSGEAVRTHAWLSQLKVESC